MQNIEQSLREGDQITIWYRYNSKEREWEHNHIEDGWVFNSKPIPVADTLEGREHQFKAWKGAKWKKSWGYYRSGKIVEIAKTREK